MHYNMNLCIACRVRPVFSGLVSFISDISICIDFIFVNQHTCTAGLHCKCYAMYIVM